MALDATDIRVAGDAKIWFAPVGTAFPAAGAAPGTGWVEVGYVTPDGVTFTFGREVTEIFAMQSLEPVRVVNTRAPRTVAFSMMQQGADQLALALGGGSVVADTVTGYFRYTPPEASANDERAMLVEMMDGTIEYRWEIPRCQNREAVESKLVREDSTNFPVTMQLLVPEDGSPSFELVTNDAAYDPAGLVLVGADDGTEPDAEPTDTTEPAYV